MKRESGENPGQTRCCKFPLTNVLEKKTWPLSAPRRWEGVSRMGTSQKTCQELYMVLHAFGI